MYVFSVTLSGVVAASSLTLLELISQLVHTNHEFLHHVHDHVMFGLYCINEGWLALWLLYFAGHRVAGWEAIRLHLQGCCYHLGHGFGFALIHMKNKLWI